MAKFRQIYTSFWSHPYIQEEMTAEDKYFYLYLLTNEQTKQIGVYQITKKQMVFDTGYSPESINSLVKRFEEYHKLIKYDPETREIVILKWGGLNLNRGGKPIEDLIKKELQEVKNKEFIKEMLKDCPDNALKKVIEDYLKVGEVEFLPSKDIRRRYIRLREKNKCFYTGKELEEHFDISHIKNDGNNSIYNLVACSKEFNWDKSNLGLKDACIKNGVNLEEIKTKIENLKAFETEREKKLITYRDAISKNIFDLNTIRKNINTNRKEENENEPKKDEVNEINAFYDTSAIKNKEQIINNNYIEEDEEKKNDPIGRIKFFFDALIKNHILDVNETARDILIKNHYSKLMNYSMDELKLIIENIKKVNFINRDMRERNGNDRNFIVWIANNADSILIEQYQDFKEGNNGKSGITKGNRGKDGGNNEGKATEYTKPSESGW